MDFRKKETELDDWKIKNSEDLVVSKKNIEFLAQDNFEMKQKIVLI